MDASAMSAALWGARGARGTSACGNDPLRFRRERTGQSRRRDDERGRAMVRT